MIIEHKGRPFIAPDEWLAEHDAKIRADAIENFAKWLKDNDYIHDVEIDYDYEGKPDVIIIPLSAKEVVKVYSDECKELLVVKGEE